MMDFIEEHRRVFGVEPICIVLPIAPSTYHERLSIARDPDRAPGRARSDAAMCLEIDRVWKASRKVQGARKVWRALHREGQDIARCTVERLMAFLEIKGVVRGKKIITTNPMPRSPAPTTR